MGTNYGRGIIKQVEELTLENERLVSENERLRIENKELNARLSALEASMETRISVAVYAAVKEATKPLLDELAVKNNTIEKLTAEVERLRAQLGKNSGNSSKPPSGDGLIRIKNSRVRSGRKSGGQRGHPGKRLELPKNLDELVEKGAARRELVDHTNGAESYVSRYTIDIETQIVVTEHRYLNGEVPPGAEVTYGDSFKTLTVLLSSEGLIAEERLSDFFNQITNGVITISDGTIDNYLSEFSEKLSPELDEIITEMLNKPVVGVDDSPMNCTEKPDYSDIDENGEPVMQVAEGTSFSVYLRTYSTDTETIYTVNPRKDAEGIERDGILPRYIGILSHDHESKFYNYGSDHGTCGAHLSRDLLGMYELQKIPWARDMRGFITGINDHKNADLEAGKNSCDPKVLEAFELGYDEMVEKGRLALSALNEKELGYDELRRMINRLTNYKDNYLLFIRDYDVPFTSNQAERDLRPAKTKQKVSGTFRSWLGINRYARIRSFISTVKKRSLGVLDSISRVFRGSRVIGADG